MFIRVSLTLMAALALNAQDQPAAQPIGRGVNFYSVDKEVALGNQLAADFRRTHSPLDSAATRDYIQQMGERLVRALPQEAPFSYHFELTNDSTGTFLEPASLPGGYIFVPAGLILAAKDEAELAGTLAHAIAHVEARHATRLATKADIAQLATIPLIFWGGWIGYGANQDAAVLLPIGFLNFQRAMESEADALVARIASAAGYDPAGLASFIDREQKDPAQASTSSLPSRDRRVQAIRQAIRALPPQTYTSSGDFARIQEEVRGLVPPPPTPSKPPTLQR